MLCQIFGERSIMIPVALIISVIMKVADGQARKVEFEDTSDNTK